MRTVVITVILTLFASSSFALDSAEFEALIEQIQNNELDTPKAFLDKNQERYGEDPDYYVVLLNYSLTKADLSQIIIARGAAQEGDFEFSDPKTGESIGFMGVRGGYDEKIIHDAIARTIKALPKFESRLDIHFGMVYMAEKINDWKLLSELLTNAINISKRIDNKWIWGPLNEMSGNPKDFLIENIQAKTYTMFYEESNEADKAFVKISRKLIDTYPESIYGYANLGVYYLAKKQYKKAESYYEQALEIDPNDEIVKSNYEQLKNMRAAQ